MRFTGGNAIINDGMHPAAAAAAAMLWMIASDGCCCRGWRMWRYGDAEMWKQMDWNLQAGLFSVAGPIQSMAVGQCWLPWLLVMTSHIAGLFAKLFA